MKIKTFYAKTMAEAMREIKDKLGPEALLLSTKEIPRKSGVWRNSSRFEVVAAIDRSEDVDVFSPSLKHKTVDKNAYSPEHSSAKTQPGETISTAYSPAMVAGRQTKFATTQKRRRNDLENDHVSETSEKESLLNEPVPQLLYQDLVNCGVDEALARHLLLSAMNDLTAEQRLSHPALLRAAEAATRSLIAAPSTQNGMPGKKVVVFVGPTGVGKTTSIAKLAARLALKEKKKVVLVSLDGYRIGAIEQLRSYAGLIGVPFRFVDQAPELDRVIKDNRQRDYVLIDTAGRGPRDMGSMRSLADYLKQSEFIERHLVLSASTKSADIQTAMGQFEPCSPDHLLFTKLDETMTPGPILNELVRTQKAFSYYTDGQRVPEDLHPVPKERIMDIILKRNESPLEV